MSVADRRPSQGITGRLAEWLTAWWKMLAGGRGALGASVIAMAAHQIEPANGRLAWSMAAGVSGAAAGLEGILVYVLLQQFRRLPQAESQSRGLVNVCPLTHSLPLHLGGWAADPVLADEVVRTVIRRDRRLIVDCGSGWRTVLIAWPLSELGAGGVLAFEHEQKFVDRIRRLLASHGGAQLAEIVLAPLAERKLPGETRRWYGEEAEVAIAKPVDLLLMDGPPEDIGPESRYPDVSLLKDSLTSDAIVILEDGRPEPEAQMAEAWERQLDVSARFVDSSGRL